MKILLSGASGFVGGHLLDSMKSHEVSLLARHAAASSEYITFEKPLSEFQDFSDCCSGVDVVVHLAALVHNMDASAQPSFEEYMSVNCAATSQLARCASESGVKHFIFLSSIKVNGEDTDGRGPFKATDPHCPVGNYAISKSEAELQLLSIADESGMTVSIIRPPLIYGPGVKANFAGLVGAIRRGFPLINASGAGYRSLVSIWNLCSLLNHLIERRPASSKVYLVSDDSDVSLGELMQLIAEGMGNKNYVLNIPAKTLLFLLCLTGQRERGQKLLNHLQVDITETKRLLAWRPCHDTREGLARMLKEK